MKRVRLTKLSTNSNALRTNVVEGDAPRQVIIGERFRMFSEALELPGGARFVETSPVVVIEADTFTTESGTLYRLEELST